ncbi:MAG TPA: glucose 1-dehydrogenase [Caulobacteraceae bacterium]|nr:glucose 1-dehydrogenase [Caulobacteraceae bacterium]
MSELQGRVALVTGASRGIGEATARALAAAGARVIVTDLADTTALAAEIGGLARRQDTTSEADWEATVAFARAEAGGLDILVNNAGVLAKGGPIITTTLEEWRRVHSVNVEGVFLGCKHAAPALIERAPMWKGGAAIVNLSSVAGLVGFAGSACYGASKGAVRLMTKCIALELAPMKVRCNSVHPGVIDTVMGGEVITAVSQMGSLGANEARDRVDHMHPMGHMGAVADIAQAIVYLASDKAAFMTGSEMVVDGGLTAG